MKHSPIRGRKYSGHTFSKVPATHKPRSLFRRDFTHKTTMNAGYLVPVLIDNVLPGDTYTCTSAMFARFGTTTTPIMDDLFVDFHAFYVPSRILCNFFEKFYGQLEPNDFTSYALPTISITAADATVMSLYDYMGIPALPGAPNAVTVNSLPFRAYNMIYNWHYRDENIQPSVFFDDSLTTDTTNHFTLLRRGKRHDYFTSCLPFAQKGLAVTLPLGTIAPVLTSATPTVTGAHPILKFTDITGAAPAADSNLAVRAADSGVVNAAPFLGSPTEAYYPSNLYADLTQATAATINELRDAITAQQYLELNARGGTRYNEYILAHFGVTVPDSRLQQPEFLGSHTVKVSFNPVAQTSQDTTGHSLGDLGAYGTMGKVQHLFHRTFTEHGYVMVLASMRQNYTYQQGIERFWFEHLRPDIYDPILANIGEQPVFQQEIYATGVVGPDTTVFGFQEAWADYRYKPSRISGQFRSGVTDSLDDWHLAQDFGSAPTLSPDFIVENPPLDRVLATDTEPALLVDILFKIKAARVMPLFSVPGLKRL